MAVSRHTQKDIGNYEAKLIGPFTTRQLICIAIGTVPSVLIDYILYTLGFDIYTMFGVTFIIMVIPCFFAFGSKFTYDMKPEDFLTDYYHYHILAPKIRLYKTETLDDLLEAEDKKKQASEAKNSKSSKTETNTFGKMKIYPHKPDKNYPDFV